MKKIIALFILLVAGVAGSCDSKKTKAPDYTTWKNGMVRVVYSNKTTTPSGVTIYSPHNVAEEYKGLVDAGFKDGIEDGKKSFYANKFDGKFYDVFFPENGCVQAPESKIWSFQIRATQYDGSEYDQYNPQGVGVHDGIGIIYVAEMVAAHGIGGAPVNGIDASRVQIVLCPEGSIMRTAMKYGMEHVLAANNDYTYWEATYNHAQGGGHPILPQTTPRNPTKWVQTDQMVFELVYDPDQPVPVSKQPEGYGYSVPVVKSQPEPYFIPVK